MTGGSMNPEGQRRGKQDEAIEHRQQHADRCDETQIRDGREFRGHEAPEARGGRQAGHQDREARVLDRVHDCRVARIPGAQPLVEDREDVDRVADADQRPRRRRVGCW